MSEFNAENRTRNVIRASVGSTLCTALSILLGFAYRTVFIRVLSENYLGISGLFTNVLTVLSLTELGMTDALNFRLYAPIADGDTDRVGRVMNFYRRVYLVIAAVILVLGLCLLPFLEHLIKDTSEVPADVNLRLVYLLFLAQTVVSYTWSCRQMLLVADQKQHVYSMYQSLIGFVRYAVQLALLFLTRSYTATLIAGIGITVLLNCLVSLRIGQRYRNVFAVKGSLSPADRRQIFSDTGATACHKVGAVVLTGTDSIIVARFVGLAVTGIYSNYAMLLNYLQSLLGQALGSFTGSIGSAHSELSAEENHRVFRRLQFVCFWVASVCTVCTYTLINDFITVWLGERMVLDRLTVIALSMQFYLETDRKIVLGYTCGSGLFVRDKWRPIAEALINIAVSLWLVLKIGLAGVFFGTAVSHLATFSWRAPYILYRDEFKQKSGRYWLAAAFFAAVTAALCAGFDALRGGTGISAGSLGAWIAEGLVCFTACNLVLALLLHRTEEYRFFKDFLREKLKKHLPAR